VNIDVPEGVPGAGAIGDVDQEALLASFLRRFASMLEGSTDEVVLRWRAVSQTLGRRVEATTVAGDVARGTAVDLDGTGALLIEAPGGKHPVRVAFGEIEHLATPPA
jgi:biotin-(acetyl-CoA carboxylase) ligase